MLRKQVAWSPVWLFAVLAWTGSGNTAPPERVRHPNLHAALYELREARRDSGNSSPAVAACGPGQG